MRLGGSNESRRVPEVACHWKRGVACRRRAAGTHAGRPRPAGEGAGRVRESRRHQDAHARRAAGGRMARAGLGRGWRGGGRRTGGEAFQAG